MGSTALGGIPSARGDAEEHTFPRRPLFGNVAVHYHAHAAKCQIILKCHITIKVTYRPPDMAVAQKSPCEEIRVIMGKESLLKLSQRGPDAREEVPMRTPKRLYAEERIIYRPELLTCLHCGDLLVAWNYLAWDKIVQTLDGLLSVATRPSRCPHATC